MKIKLWVSSPRSIFWTLLKIRRELHNSTQFKSFYFFKKKKRNLKPGLLNILVKKWIGIHYFINPPEMLRKTKISKGKILLEVQCEISYFLAKNTERQKICNNCSNKLKIKNNRNAPNFVNTRYFLWTTIYSIYILLKVCWKLSMISNALFALQEKKLWGFSDAVLTWTVVQGRTTFFWQTYRCLKWTDLWLQN